MRALATTIADPIRVAGTAARVGWLTIVALSLFAAPSWAQDGTVQGRLRDDEGSAVVGASVVLSADDRTVGGAATNDLGSFRISGVPPGQYDLSAAGLGYGSVTLAVFVGPGETVNVDLRVAREAIELEGLSVDAERSRDRIRFEEIGGVTVRELAIEDLRRIPSVAEVDPVRAVEVLPGVVSTSDFSASFNVRGGSQDQNLVLLDGVPIFSPFHLGGFFSVFNADMIDRVELQSGGFPTKHGGRVSSVLEVDTDAGDGTFGVDGGVSLQATRVAVSGGLPRGAANALGQANVHYRVSARRSYLDWILKPVFEFPYHLQDFQGIVEGWTHSGDRLTLAAYSGRDVLNLTEIDPDDFPLRIDWDWGNDLVGFQWTRPRAGGGSLDVRANFTRFATGLSFPDFDDTDFRSRIQQAQLRADLDTRPTEAWTVTSGVSTERLAYSNLFETGGTEFGRGDGTGVLVGSYAQAAWSRPLKWLMEAGLRLDLWKPNPGSSVVEVSPRVAVKRFLSGGDLAVKLAVGRYTQFLHSLRDEELPIGLDVWTLAGQRAPHVVSDQLQLGLEGYRGADWFWSVEAYARSFDGVVAVNTADDPNDDLDDILSGEGTSFGADLFVRKESGAVNGWISLSLLKAERTFPDLLSPTPVRPTVTYPPIFDKRIDVDLVLQFPAPWGWEGGLRWNVGSGTPYTRAVASYATYGPRFVDDGARLRWAGSGDGPGAGRDFAVVLGDRNTSRYPTYHRLDVSFRKEFVKSWGSLAPYLSVLNVYNQRNPLFYFYEYDRSPATRSGVSMFPVLPTFGLEVKF